MNDINFKNTPFSILIEEVYELIELRKEYANKSYRERKLAADYQYHSSIADNIFDEASGRNTSSDQPWPGEILALVIDPLYAPAILTVGSYEYIYGRKNEAMNHFLSLTKLPKDTEDLFGIIDKAAEFMIENKDYENAIIIYISAVNAFPQTGLFHNGLSNCYGMLGTFSKAIEEAKSAVNLDNNNHIYLNDLGWSLVEAGHYEEAQPILEKAIRLSPPGYSLPRNNLIKLQKRKGKI